MMDYSSPYALVLSEVTVKHTKSVVLERISLSIPQGTMTALVGPNGAGKTTLIKTIVRLAKPEQGSIVLFGTKKWSAQRGIITYVPQRNAVDWDFPATVYDVVLMGCYGRLGLFRRPSKIERQQAWSALEQVDMVDYAQRPIGQLSGGQQQRVFLARALVHDGLLFLLDEPCNGIDAQAEQIIMRLLKQLAAQGKTIVVVHHDLASVPAYFDTVVLLNKTIIATGSPQSVLTQSYVSKTYGRPFFPNFFLDYKEI